MHKKTCRFAILCVVTLAFFTPGIVHTQCFLPNTGPRVGALPNPEVVRGFVEAMRTPGENARVAAVREYLQKVLDTADWKTKNKLEHWLAMQYATVDPRPYEDLLEALECTTFLDRGTLHRDRSLQLEFFSKALNEGHATLPHGWWLGANTAVWSVAEYGLVELKSDVLGFYSRDWISYSSATQGSGSGSEPLVRDFNAKAYEESKVDYPLQTFELDLELHAGGKDYDDANRLAAKRLAEMPATELRNYVLTMPGFAGVLSRIASYACSVNLFTGKQRPACWDVMKAYVHERWLMEDLKRRGVTPKWPKGFARLGWCYIDGVPFGDYAVVPPDEFLSPAHLKILAHSREELRRRRESRDSGNGQGGTPQ